MRLVEEWPDVLQVGRQPIRREVEGLRRCREVPIKARELRADRRDRLESERSARVVERLEALSQQAVQRCGNVGV